MRGVVLAALLGLAGCFLPDPAPPPRYFTPGAPDAPRDRAAAAVRLGVVESPLHLREAMTWRRSEVEYGFYDQRRWTELPATYVERALARELFPAGTSIPTAPDLPLVNVEVRAFEEVVEPIHEARVAVAVVLADGRCIRLRRTFDAARPLDGDEPAAVARGVGEALDEVVRSAGDAIRDALVRRGRCGA
jgi:ABC-type uncharacterized transport system auxiliary subunit